MFKKGNLKSAPFFLPKKKISVISYKIPLNPNPHSTAPIYQRWIVGDIILTFICKIFAFHSCLNGNGEDPLCCSFLCCLNECSVGSWRPSSPSSSSLLPNSSSSSSTRTKQWCLSYFPSCWFFCWCFSCVTCCLLLVLDV